MIFNTESIFEVIGNEPVLDQFDILYTNLMSGTIYDNYVTGSLLISSPPFFVQGERGLAFSRLNTSNSNEDYLPSQKTSYRKSYEYQSWRERSGIIRNVRHFSSHERYYDSMTPNLTDYINALDGKISFFFDSANIVIGEDPAMASALEPIKPQGLKASFPFEPKFSNIKRMNSLLQGTVASVDQAGVSIPPVVAQQVRIIEFNSNTLANFWLNDFNLFKAVFSQVQLPTTAFDTSKILFGFGDRVIKINYLGNTYIDGGLVNHRFHNVYSLPPPLYYYSIGPVIRGWKYGLLDGNPHYTSAVFRRDRYGQFRDMLEQRKDSCLITDTMNDQLKINYREAEKPAIPSKNDSLLQEYGILQGTITNPVAVSFVQQQIIDDKIVYINKDPSLTWSSNLSLHATSSLPYFDGDSRNRGEIDPALIQQNFSI